MKDGLGKMEARICAALAECGGPANATEIQDCIVDSGERIDLANIYNTLARLEAQSAVNRSVVRCTALDGKERGVNVYRLTDRGNQRLGNEIDRMRVMLEKLYGAYMKTTTANVRSDGLRSDG